MSADFNVSQDFSSDFSRDRLQGALVALKTPSSPRWNLIVRSQVTSTNRELWQQIDAGAPSGTVVLATRQTAGRGQRDRHWASPPGGLYLSVGFALGWAARYGSMLTVAAGWGIATALRDRQIPVSLKWLNDLILGDRKLGGILTETRLSGDRIERAAIGVGINWRNDPPDPGVSLAQFWAETPQIAPFSLETLAALVLSGIDRGLQRLHRQGPAAVLPDYERLLVHRNRRVAVGEGDDTEWGTCLGVDEDGSLRLRFDDGREQSFRSGTLSLGYGANLTDERPASPKDRAGDCASRSSGSPRT